MTREIDADLQPLFKMSFDMVKEMLDETEADLAHERATLARERELVDLLEWLLARYRSRDEEMRADYLARLKALGMSDEQIKEFHEYWRDHTERIFDHD